MSEFESEWTPDGEEPPKKKRFPRGLLIGCGCGCFTLVLVLVAAAALLFKVASEGRDPEVQWPRIRTSLPFDERPTDLTLTFGLSPEWLEFLLPKAYFLEDRSDGYMVVILAYPNANPNEMGETFDPDSPLEIPFALGQPADGVAKAVLIQGREHRALFYRAGAGQSDAEAKGPGVRIDASGDQGFVLVDLRLFDSGSKEVPEDVIQSFFAHFNLGGD